MMKMMVYLLKMVMFQLRKALNNQSYSLVTLVSKSPN